jgi:hypothetical protein
VLCSVLPKRADISSIRRATPNDAYSNFGFRVESTLLDEVVMGASPLLPCGAKRRISKFLSIMFDQSHRNRIICAVYQTL